MRSSRSGRRSGASRASSGRSELEKSTNASTTVATTKAASIQRYAPMSYRPAASTSPGGGPAAPAMPARGLEDAHRAPADRGRQDLPGRVGDEIRADEPRQPF